MYIYIYNIHTCVYTYIHTYVYMYVSIYIPARSHQRCIASALVRGAIGSSNLPATGTVELFLLRAHLSCYLQ